LDIDYIFTKSNLGKKIILSLSEENKTNLNLLKKEENELIKNEKNLINKKKILSQTEFDSQLTELKSQISLFKKKRDNLINEFETRKNNEIKIFFSKINPILKNYMKKNSIKIIVDKKNILIGEETLDLTNKIFDLINNELN
tara:strand:- start:1458 stop:1883 length:426 start_codon:yes stop_codon:yes gene_type:complete